MFEFTCAHEDPLKAADDALRAKGYLRSLADEYGLVPTFMPALHMHSADSHNGAHHNISVWRDGEQRVLGSRDAATCRSWPATSRPG